MTESTSTSNNPTIDNLVLKAYRHAGLINVGQSLTTAQGSAARDLFDDIVDEVEAQGVFCRSVQMFIQTIQAGVTQYTMSSDVLDVVGDGAYIDPTQTNLLQATAETPVTLMTREQWQGLSAKAAEGRPLMYWPDRSAGSVVVNVWPVPDISSDQSHVRFQLHKLRPDVVDGSKTLPFERYWAQYFVWELAHQLAMQNSLNMARVSYMANVAQQKYKTARGYSKQQMPTQAILNHPSAWGGRYR